MLTLFKDLLQEPTGRRLDVPIRRHVVTLWGSSLAVLLPTLFVHLAVSLDPIRRISQHQINRLKVGENFAAIRIYYDDPALRVIRLNRQ